MKIPSNLGGGSQCSPRSRSTVYNSIVSDLAQQRGDRTDFELRARERDVVDDFLHVLPRAAAFAGRARRVQLVRHGDRTRKRHRRINACSLDTPMCHDPSPMTRDSSLCQ